MAGIIPPGAVLLFWWYIGIVYVAFLIGIAVSVWISYDANRKGLEATIPQAIGVISTILMLPSLIMALFPTIMIANPNLIVPMGYLGIIGGVGAIFAGLAYAMGGVEPPEPRPVPPTRHTPAPEPLPQRTARPRVRRTERTKLVGERVAPAAWLVAKTGSRSGQQLGLKRGANTIGRSSRKCDLVVEDGTVSGEHARIQFENGQFVIYDLASLNGTFVNGQRTQRQLLMDGDEIKLGDSVFVFKKV